MIEKLKELLIRAVTGAAFVACVVGAIIGGEYTFFALFSLIAIGAVCEYARMMNRTEHCVNVTYSVVGTALLCTTLFLHPTPYFAPLLAVYMLLLLIVFASELALKPSRIGAARYFIIGQIAIAMPFALLFALSQQQQQFTPEVVLLLLCTIWVNDTFAYLSGTLFGRHRMAEKISPKKSWEGFVGGILCSVAVCCTAAWLLAAHGNTFFASHHWTLFGLMAIIIVVFGTMGDLLESMIKRRAGVKDSGKILPGHGGLLDRFDSLLMATPALYLVMELIHFFEQ